MISFKYSTRLVIILKNIVIKIPLSKRGYLQGLSQKRYNTVTEIPKANVKYLKYYVSEFNFKNCDLYNCENWGIENNKYILLDYGINKKISNLYK
jgi:hypothetical protein